MRGELSGRSLDAPPCPCRSQSWLITQSLTVYFFAPSTEPTNCCMHLYNTLYTHNLLEAAISVCRCVFVGLVHAAVCFVTFWGSCRHATCCSLLVRDDAEEGFTTLRLFQGTLEAHTCVCCVDDLSAFLWTSDRATLCSARVCVFVCINVWPAAPSPICHGFVCQASLVLDIVITHQRVRSRL